MDLPIYQIEAYQKAPPKVKHTNFTHKSPDWSLQPEKYEKPLKKVNEMLLKSRNYS